MKFDKKPGEYDVGYRKPPVDMRFRKGRSGNPKGRPKRAQGLDESLAEKLDEVIWIEREGRREAVTKRELGIILLIIKALKDDIGALRKLFQLIRQLDPPREQEAFKVVYIPTPRWMEESLEEARKAEAEAKTKDEK